MGAKQMESVLDERKQAGIDRIRDEACESGLEAVAKHLDAMAKLLLRAKRDLGFAQTVADDAAIKLAVDETSELVADIANHLPVDVRDLVCNLDETDELGPLSESVIDSVNSCIELALKNAARSLAKG
jgi:Zn-dependent oligopeptidase